jgi:hypothetical protein
MEDPSTRKVNDTGTAAHGFARLGFVAVFSVGDRRCTFPDSQERHSAARCHSASTKSLRRQPSELMRQTTARPQGETRRGGGSHLSNFDTSFDGELGLLSTSVNTAIRTETRSAEQGKSSLAVAPCESDCGWGEVSSGSIRSTNLWTKKAQPEEVTPA